MEIYRCLVIEDDRLAVDMMADYIGRREDLALVGVAQQLSDLPHVLATIKPDIVFLDLVIPTGEASDFHFGLFPAEISVVVVSAIPTGYFKGILPANIVFELLKPVSRESFENCVDQIISLLKSKDYDL